MGGALPGFPLSPRHRFRVALGDAVFGVVMTWRERCAAWYVDLYDADGTALITGRRVSPGTSPWADVVADALPESVVVAVGPDPYDRAALGAALALVSWDAADLGEDLPYDDEDVVGRLVVP